jgi:hypothetical protein
MEQSNGVDALQTEERLREEDGNGVIAAPQALVRQSKSTVFFFQNYYLNHAIDIAKRFQRWIRRIFTRR